MIDYIFEKHFSEERLATGEVNSDIKGVLQNARYQYLGPNKINEFLNYLLTRRGLIKHRTDNKSEGRCTYILGISKI